MSSVVSGFRFCIEHLKRYRAKTILYLLSVSILAIFLHFHYGSISELKIIVVYLSITPLLTKSCARAGKQLLSLAHTRLTSETLGHIVTSSLVVATMAKAHASHRHLLLARNDFWQPCKLRNNPFKSSKTMSKRRNYLLKE